MYRNVKRTCRVLFWLINPIVLWRSRCRRRRRCLSSLNSHWFDQLFTTVVICWSNHFGFRFTDNQLQNT